MSRKILFFLSSDSFHAHVWKNGALSAPFYFTTTLDGLAKFSDFLKAYPDPAYLLVDLIEEDFRQETVPHLIGANRHALIQRKFEQYYRSTPFRMASLQQRQSEGRRDDELLFSALTNPARISAWLELLLLHNTPIVGIYSVPHASIPLIKDVDSDHLLLLSWEKNSGLRQSYFLNKRLRFSRLTSINPNGTFADAIATESARTHQYLQSLSLTPQGELLNVHIICHASDRAQLDARLPANLHMRYGYLDLQQLGKSFKSQYVFPDSDATPLYLHLLATQPPRASYAASKQTHFYQLWQTRRGLLGLAAATALACLAWGTFSFLEGKAVSGEIDSIKDQASRMMRDTQQITQHFPISTRNAQGGTASASDMKTAVTLFRNLQYYSVPPRQILQGLTETLNNFPSIYTDKLAWQSSAAAGPYPEQIITFNGELADFGNDYRGALNYLERFQLMLTRAGYSVTPVKLPLDFSTKGSIGADIGESSDKPSDFSLKITWKPQP
ncbi:MAG: hypothetical protein B7Y56_00105 [Gallionellales bacterium 35-53-114]|jgi:hypothetical protein|nr:MAG: hypothetical protein B7Y56_00105 [Gallionellales bacterium 35-53-114]OYZ62242.1 MAG: hypothetical protein B7Y04_14740 [Gallionellales bacterium 24-53-125]OZB10637.1 MAG: hypothetical protein B7X61_03805 [Gallionellales bacterium 39-52-133]HQS57272.1 hypothetical protein [Gallionellaceae bacterium]HQS74540.1 hypothetical protein [Gallionellaceae bacterium]